MKHLLIIFISLLQITYSQINPIWTYEFSDTNSSFAIHDFYVDNQDDIYFAGQMLTESNRDLYVAAISVNSNILFEFNIRGDFENEGQYIIPLDDSHFAVTGISEDSSGTFNFKTAKVNKTGNILWDNLFGKDGLTIMDQPTDIESDLSGNIVVAGSSASIEQQYTLVQYSPEGNVNWSVRHKPFETGQFIVNDIIIDANGNIYGITRNTFVQDTLNGTIFKRDKSGNLLWEKNYNISFSIEPSDHLLLINDTLYVAGTFLADNMVNGGIVCLSLSSDGELLSYRRHLLPGKLTQQSVRDLNSLGDNLILANESYSNPDYYLHVFVLSKDFSIVHRDSISSPSETKAIISAMENTFTVISYGGELFKMDYHVDNGIILRNVLQLNTDGQPVSKTLYHNNDIYTLYNDFGFPLETSTIKKYSFSTAIEEQPHLGSNTFTLYPAYPNPFNLTVNIKFRIPGMEGNSDFELVSLKIYDILGTEIVTLVNEYKSAGFYTATWDGRNNSGQPVASGIYFYKLIVGQYIETQKMNLIK